MIPPEQQEGNQTTFKVKLTSSTSIPTKRDGSGKELESSTENKTAWKSTGEHIRSSGEGGFGRRRRYLGRLSLGIQIRLSVCIRTDRQAGKAYIIIITRQYTSYIA